jgi:hypothetical protein
MVVYVSIYTAYVKGNKNAAVKRKFFQRKIKDCTVQRLSRCLIGRGGGKDFLSEKIFNVKSCKL